MLAMTGPRARLMGLVFAALLIVGVGANIASETVKGGTEVKAEFKNVTPLLEGADVRVSGARAGEVEKLELTDRGTVMATMRLNDGISPPRRDATARIESADFLGEVYISLAPGDEAAPLEDPIPTRRTIRRAQLQDVLNIMRAPARVGLQALLTELGRGLDRRGADLNEAIIELRPTLESADELLAALASQRTALRRLIGSAELTTSQVARRHSDLDRQLVAFDRLLSTTAAHTGQLDRGLETLPPTLTEARRTLAGARDLASAAQPLARDLFELSPDLAEIARRLGPFTESARPAIAELRPTLSLTRRLLGASKDTVPALIRGGRTLHEAAPALADLMRYSGPQAVRSLTEGFVKGRGSATIEGGNQPGKQEDSRRFYFRATAVPGCMMFGQRPEPGCLAEFLGAMGEQAPSELLRRGRQLRSSAARPSRTRSRNRAARPTDRDGAATRSRAAEARGPAAPAAQGGLGVPPPSARDDLLLDFLLAP